jgi:hypothetical protein
MSIIFFIIVFSFWQIVWMFEMWSWQFSACNWDTLFRKKSIIVCTKTITGTENSMYFNNQRSESSCNSFLKLPRPHFKHSYNLSKTENNNKKNNRHFIQHNSCQSERANNLFKNELHEDSDLWLLKYILFSVPVIVFVHTIILFFLNSVSQLHAAYNVMVPFLIYDKNKRRVTFIFVFCVLFLNECVL